jgi:hypothetical protein
MPGSWPSRLDSKRFLPVWLKGRARAAARVAALSSRADGPSVFHILNI